VLGIIGVARAGSLPLRWVLGMRHREGPSFDHSRLRWYRDVTWAYRLTAHVLLPASLRLLARVRVEDWRMCLSLVR